MIEMVCEHARLAVIQMTDSSASRSSLWIGAVIMAINNAGSLRFTEYAFDGQFNAHRNVATFVLRLMELMATPTAMATIATLTTTAAATWFGGG